MTSRRIGLIALCAPLLVHCSAPPSPRGAEPAAAGAADSAAGSRGRPNAVLLPDGGLLALERTSPTGVGRAFRLRGDDVEVYDDEARRVATIAVGPADGSALFGGFDVDGDGLVDFGVTRSVSTGVPCGASIVHRTRVDIYATGSGTLMFSSPEEDDKCWSFPSATYPTQQWTALSTMFGPTPGKLALATYYATTASVVVFPSGAAPRDERFFYPSSPSYADYVAAQINAHGGTKYYDNSHVPNGLFVRVDGEDRLVFFTSARVVQYAGDGSDLLSDKPFLPGGRTDLVGRNYGVVAVDPAAPSRIVLLNGTPSQTLYADQLAHAMTTDPWAGIERHVTLYDVTSGALSDRFFSYAHDHGDGDQFQGRVSYPDHPWLDAGGGPSRVVYGLYDGGHWSTHVSTTTSLDDATVVRGLVPWDVRDVDGDGVDELLASPTELPGDPDVPGYYFTKWQTSALRWDEADAKFVEVRTYAGIPEPVPSFRTATTTSSAVTRLPAAVVEANGRLRLVLRNEHGDRFLSD